MRKFNTDNERVKNRYFNDLLDAEGFSSDTVDSIAKAISRYELFTQWKDFRLFHKDQTKAFKKYLVEQTNERSGKPLSKSTVHATVSHLRRFHLWLTEQPGYKSRIRLTDCAYFKLSRNDVRAANARREPRFPTLEQVRHVLARMPSDTPTLKRDRALVAFSLLTGARIRATATFRLKHVDLEKNVVEQDGNDVHTKYRKSYSTWFFPVGDEVLPILVEWIDYLRDIEKFTDQDPLFPRSVTHINVENRWVRVGFERAPWTSTGPIRAIFRRAFAAASLPYYNPHSIRKTLGHLAYEYCEGDLEAFTAWSQNLGHEDIRTTIGSYGRVSSVRQAEIFKKLSLKRVAPGRAIEERLGEIERHVAAIANRKSRRKKGDRNH